jgi:hypothetical protein
VDLENQPPTIEPEALPRGTSAGADVGGGNAAGQLLFAPLEWLRPLALLAIAATVVGRAVAPSLRGIVVGVDVWIARAELLGGVLSHMMLLAMVGMLMAITLAVLRLPRLPLAYRLVATALAGIVLGLSAPASSARLSPEFSASLSLVSIVIAILGTTQALVAPHTRVLGVLLGLMSLAALTRQTGWLLALIGGGRALGGVALLGRGVATIALLFQGLGATLALLWLATRKRRVASVGTTLAMFTAMSISWLAARVDGGGLAVWKATIGRSALRLLSPPVPLVSQGIRVFLVSLSLLLAGLALSNRRDAPAVVGTLALILIAGVDTDVPLCSLTLAVASLAAALAAHDPRSAFWSQAGRALAGQRLRVSRRQTGPRKVFKGADKGATTLPAPGKSIRRQPSVAGALAPDFHSRPGETRAKLRLSGFAARLLLTWLPLLALLRLYA